MDTEGQSTAAREKLPIRSKSPRKFRASKFLSSVKEETLGLFELSCTSISGSREGEKME